MRGPRHDDLATYRRALLDRLPPLPLLRTLARGLPAAADLHALIFPPSLSPVRGRASQPVSSHTSFTHWQDALPTAEHPSVVWVGPSGSGKTTALRSLVHALCRPDPEVPAEQRELVPIYLELSRLASVSPPRDLVELAELAEPALSSTLLRSLDAGRRLLWLLDGLDEVLAPALRSRILALLDPPGGVDPPRRILVTTRPPDPPLSASFTRFELRGWTDARIDSFVTRFHALVSTNPTEVGARATAVQTALRADPVLHQLCHNPLFLSLVVAEGRSRDLPSSLHALLDRALDQLLDTWELPVAIAPLSLGPADRRALSRRIARDVHARQRTQTTRPEIVHSAAGFLGEAFGEPEDAAARIAPRLVDSLLARHGLFVPVDGDLWSFAHPAFLDILVADDLVASLRSQHVSPAALRERFSQHWHEPAWASIFQFVCGRLADDAPHLVVSLLQAVLRSRPSLSAQVLFGPLDFALQALARCANLQREPIRAFTHALTELVLALGLDDLWGLVFSFELIGSRWPARERFQANTQTFLQSTMFALATCEPSERLDLMLRHLRHEESPSYFRPYVNRARRLGPWTTDEERRLLEIDWPERLNQHPSHRAILQLSVAAELAATSSQVAHEYLTRQLYAQMPEVRAYAALIAIRLDLDQAPALGILDEALQAGAWDREYVPSPIRRALSAAVNDAHHEAPAAVRTELLRILARAPAELARAIPNWIRAQVADSGQSPSRKESPLNVSLRFLLGIPEDTELSETSIRAALASASPEDATRALEALADSEFLSFAQWRTLARESASRCTDDRDRADFAALLDDRDTLWHLADTPGVNEEAANSARGFLAVGDALDRLLRVGQLRRGHVHLAGARVGTLVELPGRRTRFTYDPAHISRPTARAVSPTLPLRPEPYDSDGLHPYFAGLLPQGWLLQLKARVHRLATSDDLGLLLALGADLPGAVEVHPVSEDT